VGLTAAAQRKVDALRLKDQSTLVQTRLVNLHPRVKKQARKPAPAPRTCVYCQGKRPTIDVDGGKAHRRCIVQREMDGAAAAFLQLPPAFPSSSPASRLAARREQDLAFQEAMRAAHGQA
jgi:hypothetical protein